MMLSVARYQWILWSQYLFVTLDLLINASSDFIRNEPVILLCLYIVQDVCIIFSFIVLFLAFFSTYVFQVGLVGVLIREFRYSLSFVVVYLGLSIAYHACNLSMMWGHLKEYTWSYGVYVLYILQRAVLHYYFYKRAGLYIANPRYYQDKDWIRRRF